MAKVRVHELAKAHDMSSKDVLDKLRAAGLTVKAPASAVDVDQATAAIEGRPLPTNVIVEGLVVPSSGTYDILNALVQSNGDLRLIVDEGTRVVPVVKMPPTDSS